MQKIIRETTADFEYQEAGEIKKKKIRVRYFGQTLKDIKLRRAEVKARAEKDPTDVLWLSETLSKRLESLLDMPDSFNPFEITEENLDELDVKNLERIDKAIADDENPPVKKPTSA